MDCTLNKDILDCFERHAAATHHLKESTEQAPTLKWSFSSQKRISVGMLKIFNSIWNDDPLAGACPSKRIIQDVKKFLTSTRAIFDVQGVVVPGLGSRRLRSDDPT